MNWKQAWSQLRSGKKIKLPTWGGYWKLENQEIMMYLKDGRVLNIRENEDTLFTFDNIASNEWEVVE